MYGKPAIATHKTHKARTVLPVTSFHFFSLAWLNDVIKNLDGVNSKSLEDDIEFTDATDYSDISDNTILQTNIISEIDIDPDDI